MTRYINLITNYHAGSPRFVSHVDLSTRSLSETSQATDHLSQAFDIDTAIGQQLDILGLWIGRSRVVSEPLRGIYFAYDEENIGFDQGVWQGRYDADEGFTRLSDEVYRVILKAKIAINHWNGQNATLPAILDTALAGSGLSMQIVDNQNMTLSVWVFPDTDLASVSLELIAAIRQGYLTVKAAGVWAGDITYPSIETPSTGSRFFSFDIENKYMGGFDTGAWERKL
ncbi:MAG: hypothetical protein XXXJIFNMEKO3_01942 [Candidatus Erwinia impunctatus]|nr:hypothetical protein XXXJIFNMEKO_01942 [Culicoides impunctatus]